jgi:hypothetical protein
MFKRARMGGRRGSESWEDRVGEEIHVEDWQEELRGGQTEPMRSQVRVFRSKVRRSFEF